MQRGSLDPSQRAVRGTSHGKIESLESPFKAPEEKPFTIVIIPKANITDLVISVTENKMLLVNMKMYEDETASNYPVQLHTESSGLIYELSINAIDLGTYDVYWVTGV